jgi:hypothetical protein
MLVFLLLELSFGQGHFLPECLPCRIEKTFSNEGNNETAAKYACRWWNRLQDSLTETTSRQMRK